VNDAQQTNDGEIESFFFILKKLLFFNKSIIKSPQNFFNYFLFSAFKNVLRIDTITANAPTNK